MDTSLKRLLALGVLYKKKDSFTVSEDFALSKDGRKWFKQVSVKPVLYQFTDIALQHITKSTNTG
jgi:hypothetical protein